MAMNSFQKNILEAVLKFPFNEIKEFNFENRSFTKGIDDDKALKSFQLITSKKIDYNEQQTLMDWGAWEGGVKVFRDILLHPAPQNRVKDEDGFLYKQERHEGLLSLTPKNDNVTEGINKNDIVNYIHNEVKKRVSIMEEAGIKPAEIKKLESPRGFLKKMHHVDERSRLLGRRLAERNHHVDSEDSQDDIGCFDGIFSWLNSLRQRSALVGDENDSIHTQYSDEVNNEGISFIGMINRDTTNRISGATQRRLSSSEPNLTRLR